MTCPFLSESETAPPLGSSRRAAFSESAGRRRYPSDDFQGWINSISPESISLQVALCVSCVQRIPDVL